VISHIDQLTRRIPVRIDVERTGVRTSTIDVKGYDEKEYVQADALFSLRDGKSNILQVKICWLLGRPGAR